MNGTWKANKNGSFTYVYTVDSNVVVVELNVDQAYNIVSLLMNQVEDLKQEGVNYEDEEDAMMKIVDALQARLRA